MLAEWAHQHPWMTFFLGLMGLSTLNVFFISIGGGYKKFPSSSNEKEDELIVD
jgi:hypothetical protein